MQSLVVAAVGVLALAPPVRAANEVGDPAPALVVTLLDGSVLDLASLRGKVVVLNIWASWCTPCRAEMPMLDAYYRLHQREGLILLGLSADDPHDRRDVEGAMRGRGYRAGLLSDARVNGFGMPQVLPMTYVIDAQGTIRARFLPTRPGLTAPQLAAVVQPLLSAIAAAPSSR